MPGTTYYRVGVVYYAIGVERQTRLKNGKVRDNLDMTGMLHYMFAVHYCVFYGLPVHTRFAVEAIYSSSRLSK